MPFIVVLSKTMGGVGDDIVHPAESERAWHNYLWDDCTGATYASVGHL